MTFLRSKSLRAELFGRAERVVGSMTGNREHQVIGTAREYAGRAGSLTSQALAEAGRHARRRPLGLAIGVGLGVGAIAAAWLIARHNARVRPEEDEHNPTRQRPTDASGDALDGSGEDNPMSGDTARY
ncbi:hypothetical protein [Dyella sp. 333MFSha]|uniref:hypothetical protein n=1 Tax=Dyella sp. 333MFSha TaxID=1798240 RepID=UPI0008884C5E|nr:hypothetical protein [Dyella sp. 333MFSha]SDG63339.1 hypothetical protein SAMN04515659_3183 [Dyella sp. 333MFSha]